MLRSDPATGAQDATVTHHRHLDGAYLYRRAFSFRFRSDACLKLMTGSLAGLYLANRPKPAAQSSNSDVWHS